MLVTYTAQATAELPTIDVLAIGAHPDDVEMNVGGTLLKLKAQGYRTGILDMTRGEMGTRGTVEIRALEAHNAAQILGLDVRANLELPDGHISADDASRRKLVRALRRLRPKVIFAHYPEDPHPDHAHSAQIIREAAHLAHLAKYDTDFGLERHFISAIAHYLFPRTVAPTFLVDITAHREEKWAALAAHVSQFHNPNSQDLQTLLSGEDFFDRLKARDRYFGSLINVRDAEAFVVKEALNVADPMALLTQPMNFYS